ncbi:hypothetical protein CHLNCDRAFT_133891 [Chlorella variabilis]|uniref:Glycoside hydrolase family 5 domain-containing protein n=1 Tax=Chlorella variabilis TaxID=554065 RepID=E1ZEI5_CHLVA|nr:hypothetical protein CHLNCDRAFT_133891 [Chlorella variabilis]EFN55668.1 hypothetical protein CHLNCDRAFT_133891 [Chlorella variabilis]|eukprot:XP_005847770.1 hypothetical protein CHLNCDRAFT_133891 [Chlorella variabilis]
MRTPRLSPVARLGFLLLAMASLCTAKAAKRPPPPSTLNPRSLYTAGNAIYWADGTRFSGRGVNAHDARSCVACVGRQNMTEVRRRIDFAITSMCYPNCNLDAAYLADIDALLGYIGATYPRVQLLLSAWASKLAWGQTTLGWPTATTNARWQQVVSAVGHHPHVWFGVVNEPEYNFNGGQDAQGRQVWQAMNSAVAAIREQEAALGQPPHIVTVQGTRAWGRTLAYYLTNPITAGQGINVVYETHASTGLGGTAFGPKLAAGAAVPGGQRGGGGTLRRPRAAELRP